MAKRIDMPHHADLPYHFLLWQVDEVAPLAIGLIIGVITEYMGVCLLLGLISVSFYRRFRDGKPEGYILHYLYWVGLTSCKSNTTPDSFIKRFFP